MFFTKAYTEDIFENKFYIDFFCFNYNFETFDYGL